MTHEEVMEQVRENIISLVSAAIYTSFDFPKGMTWAELAKEIISIPEIKEGLELYFKGKSNAK